MNKKIKVLIVDGSAVVRQTLKDILSSDERIEVLATASDPITAVQRLKGEIPDVITLDVERECTDAIEFLKKLMAQHPISIVICSSLTGRGSNAALKALEHGAVEIVEMPGVGVKQFLEKSRTRICDAVKAASRAAPGGGGEVRKVAPKLCADVVIARPKTAAVMDTTEKVVVVGASTGGTEALAVFLESLPSDCPAIAIVQHMPEHFTGAFAKRLDAMCRISVKEAENNDILMRGRALIAPGNHHMLLKRSGARYLVEIREGPPVCRHRPSVDVLFRSAALYAGKNSVGVIMTGMGDDGAKGMAEMKESGAFTIAQDEKSCVVFGMPCEAIKKGAVDRIVSLEQIAGEVLRICRRIN
ncbi:MAG: chemotaxis response regulator protein-glutamate methylesterase [Syntrophobacteraceae bacterium]|nr:chemotaxis response regulator protein-glutamate methylesterase [Syntrophobacteraceae bacterium]